MTQDAGSECCASPMSTGGRGIPLARASLGFESNGASNGEKLTAAPLPPALMPSRCAYSTCSGRPNGKQSARTNPLCRQCSWQRAGAAGDLYCTAPCGACSSRPRRQTLNPKRKALHNSSCQHCSGQRAGAAGDLDRDGVLRPGHAGAGHPAGALHPQPGASLSLQPQVLVCAPGVVTPCAGTGTPAVVGLTIKQ